MNADQQKNYEEAAKKSLSELLNKYEDTDYVTGFLAGAAHAHNEAIDAAIKLFKTRGSFGTPFIDELEKLKKL